MSNSPAPPQVWKEVEQSLDTWEQQYRAAFARYLDTLKKEQGNEPSRVLRKV